MKLFLNLLTISMISSNIIQKVIDETTPEIVFECQLNDKNTMFWIKDGKDMAFDINYMSFQITKRNQTLVTVLTILIPNGQRDQGVYECNGNKYQVINRFAEELIAYTKKQFETEDEIQVLESFFKFFWINLKVIFESLGKSLNRLIEFYKSLDLITSFFFGFFFVLIILLMICNQLFASVYKKSADNYSKIIFILDSKLDQMAKDIKLNDEDIEDEMDENIVDYSFVSLLKD